MYAPFMATLFAVAVFEDSGAGQEKKAPYPRSSPIVEVVEKTRHSIVCIRIPRASGRDIIGTGVVIHESGIVVTNRHLVGGARTVNVLLADGTPATAQVLASESAWDLAILRLKIAHTVPALSLSLGPVEDLMVGETVIAIGHPFGYTNSVSTGIISALGRKITMPTGDVLTGLIQTDASINVGNSGGPLLNINGELIGINVALHDGAHGIAFAINADTVKAMLRKHASGCTTEPGSIIPGPGPCGLAADNGGEVFEAYGQVAKVDRVGTRADVFQVGGADRFRSPGHWRYAPMYQLVARPSGRPSIPRSR
jgi:serine protease Do